MSNLRGPKEGELEGKGQTTLQQPPPPTQLSPTSMVLPPSPPLAPSVNSSPAHEFSFTISLHPPNSHSTNSSNRFNLGKHTTTPLDVDLAPADEIFFHGHLLPLHFLSHRPSDFSTENAGFLPLDHVETEKKQSTNAAAAPIPSATPGGSDHFHDRRKPKTFSSLFGLRKWLKGNENRPDEDQQRRGRKKLFDVARLWKKYANLIEPLLLFKGWKTKQEFRRSPHSFSGGSISREGGWRQRWRGEYSAPASIRTSPTNSGLLVAPASILSSSDESTMEELQNAIQAAIAHCKDSIAAKDDKCRGCVGIERVN
ncbi:hypothetical protein HPP92_016119 [Vanilla planifolia]|uniref:BRI1 kinase inhibitor 1 n=1 Tax=Vanilla planifolia TaxID=51239 RepID=A0A835QN16_VANPL|nr:hypothetical protein HPP92_016119 [Vanilla planifolia]